MKKSILSLSLIAAGTLLAGSAMAQYTVLVGGAYVDPNSSAGTATGPLTPLGAISLTVKPQTTLFFSVAREINDKWDLEVAMGFPPTHDVALRVTDASALPASVAAQDGVIISKVRQVAPTVFANYKFGDAGSKFRPFVGAGINYTQFDQTESTAANNAINGGPTNIKLSDSWGLAWHAGAVYKFDKQWSLMGSYATAQVNSVITTNTLGIERKVDISFRPAVFIMAVGYSF
jgi:outer membrane protein